MKELSGLESFSIFVGMVVSYICQKSSLVLLKYVHFTICKFYH